MPASDPATDRRLVALETQLAEVASLRGEVAALRRRLARRRASTLARALAVLVVAALLATPLAALAASFIDLNGGSVHNANINAIADAGISRGCNADGSRYCPNDLVTREQMASFLARTAGLGGNPPVTNALTAVNATNAQNATNATNAVTAQTATNAPNAQPRYARVVVVGPVGTPAQNGQALRAAFDGITSASATNRYLVFIEPGVYALDDTLGNKPFVAIQGAGQGFTTITLPANLSAISLLTNTTLSHLTITKSLGQGSVVSAIDANIRIAHVTVINNSPGSSVTGITIFGGTNIVIEESDIAVTGATGSRGIMVPTSAATVTVQRSVVTVGPDASVVGVEVTATGSTLTIEDSRIISTGDTVNNSAGTVRIVRSQLAGTAPVGLGITTCTGIHDEGFVFYANFCP